jgi:hypothetical protein
MDSDSSISVIRENGFKVRVASDKSEEALIRFFTKQVFLKQLRFSRINAVSRIWDNVQAGNKSAEFKSQQAALSQKTEKEGASSAASSISALM